MGFYLFWMAVIFQALWLMKFVVLATNKTAKEGSLGCLDLAGLWSFCYFTWGP
jgi:hypothetical protein